MTDNPGISFGMLLRQLRAQARLTQEELAEAAGVSPRSVSDLERGINRTARKETAQLLAGALNLTGQACALFVAAARGRAAASEALAAQQGTAADVAVAVQTSAAGTLPAGAAVPQVRYSLPADMAAFTGRDDELDRITAVLTAASGAGGVVAVSAIDGMPGVGKTVLAVHAAHVLAEKFPDRQLFIDLHAHTPGQDPVAAADALAGLLAAMGVDPRYLPADLAGRAALWRDRMAGQRALLVFDNAAGSGQVAPLLPGSSGCLVLVTSRRHLGDLPGAVTPVLVDVMPPEHAAEMFTRLAPMAAGDRDGVADVVQLTGFLPLAVWLLARLLARHPSWTLADLAAETRVGVLTIAAENESIAAAFEVSYRHLDPDSQRLFRLLGMYPGTVIDSYAAAALAGIGQEDAAGLLDGLHKEGLVSEAGRRWYGMHDLLRRYARDLASADFVASGGQQALGQLLDYYQFAAALVEVRLSRQTRPGPRPSAPAAFELPGLEDAGQALEWARANRASMLACLDLAARTSQHARVIALTAGLAGLLRRDGPWAEAVIRHAEAVRAARFLGDRLGEANALTDLAEAKWLAGDYPAAAGVFDEALGIYRDLSSRLGEANALRNIGEMRQVMGDLPGADAVVTEALGIYRDLSDGLGEANALHALGIVRHAMSDCPGATRVLEESLGIYRDIGHRMGEASALVYLGYVRQESGDCPGAALGLEKALDIYRDAGYRNGEANALLYLGIVRLATGDHPGAAQILEEALGIYRDLGSRLGEANALCNLGIVQRATGDYLKAAGTLDEALSIYRDHGDRHSEIDTLNEQGTLHRIRGDPARAQECHQKALELACLIGSSRREAHALAGMGRCALATGDTAQAEVQLRQAQEILQRIDATGISDVLAELDALTRPGSPR